MAGISQYQALDFIRNEVYWLRRKWCAFRRLSVKGDNDDGVLGESAPEFFGVVQLTLKLDTGLTICRLFDRRRDTETLESALKSEMNRMRDADFKRLKESLDGIGRKLKDANLDDARKLVLAHSNQAVARGSASEPSSGFQAIEEIVQSTSDWVIELCRAVGCPYSFDETDLYSSMDGLVKRVRGM